MQRIACCDFASSMKEWKIEREVLEKGVSGYKISTNARDAIVELKQAAMAGLFDVLLVFMFDRIGRREDETPFVVQWFVEQGIEVWSTREGQQRFDNHVDKLLNYIRYWQASGESEKTAFRIRTKHSQMVQEGLYRGGLIPFGYRLEHLGRVNKKNVAVRDLVIDETEAGIVQAIYYKIADEGFGAHSVANWLNECGIQTKRGTTLWRDTSIRALIRNPVYVGCLRFGDELSEPFEQYRVVSDELFARTNELVSSRAPSKSDTRHGALRMSDGLLTGIIYCADCGQRMVYNKCHKEKHTSTGLHRYDWAVYRCFRKVNSRHTCTGQSTYRVEQIEDVVVKMVRQFFASLKNIPDHALCQKANERDLRLQSTALQRAEEELERAQKAMSALETEALKGLTGEGGLDVTMVNSLLPKARGRLASAQAEYEKIKAAVEKNTEADRQRAQEIATMRTWADTFDSANIATKRMVLAALIDRVEVARGYKIDISFRLAVGQFSSKGAQA